MRGGKLGFSFFLEYAKDLHIIVIKKKSLTIQMTHSDERPRRSTGYSHIG
jgi:hypothetical protein